ncbi:cation channel family protein (macronuclear) [Tetrahymena thermophila SB210]|uniref:Cation channel family protein n=1 Tax=Tetrahymena thermophila (strain SB210) TaxID=312017 RepID=Q23RS4_TETTS|nr:cation channel family protein [Tetrahymena thermophila SB210]EAR99211.2 cation channel family protein [Tetrahymena thermophila SB210]|eukprot:XP_001019456.2 cation channel family protein [Tetrahymena thermophila SB210]
MKLNIQKLNFEKTQKQHDEMIEIFHQRMKEKTLTEDEFGTKGASLNRMQSSFQELSSKIFQDNNLSIKIGNIGQIIDSKKRLQCNNEDSQLEFIQSKIDINYVQNDNFNISAKDKKQLQNSMTSSIQNVNQQPIFQDNPDNKSMVSSIQDLNSSCLNQNLSPTFRNRKKNNEQSDILGQQKKNQQLSGGSDIQSNQISSKAKIKQEDQQVREPSISINDKLDNNQDQTPLKLFNAKGRTFKQNKQNESQFSGIGMENSNQKQKQSQATFQNENRKKQSRKFTEMPKKQKKTNFIHIIMKMKSYAYKMASNIQSKKLAILQRQKFFYLRDKTINYNKQEKEDFEFYDYNRFQKFILLIFQQTQSIFFAKRLLHRIPTIPLFLPQSIWKFVWDIFNMIIVIVFFFYLPLYFIYGIQFSTVFYLQNLDIMLVIIATLDVFVNLNTVQYRKGNLLHSRSLILLEYFSKNGILNMLFVTILWIVVASQRIQIQLIQNYRFSIMFFAVALFKVFRQNSFKNRIYDRFYLRKINRGFISLMQIFFNLFIVTHLFACIWLIVGKINQTEDSILCAQQNAYNNYKNCTYTWLDKLSGAQNLTFYEQYLRAYYFSTVTMITVGYGDIIPVNSQEYLLSILTMLIACGMFGYSLNSIGQILSEMDINNKEYDEHFNAIYGFMYKKNISTDLQVQVREYLQYFFIQSNQEDIQKQQKVISLLPDSLQNQIMLEANKIIFENSNLFKMNFSEQIIQKTIKIIEQREFRPGQKIIVQDVENDNSIYFIEKGSVEVYNSNNNEGLKLLHKGNQFGEIQFFTGQTSQLSVRSIEFTKLLAIKRSSFFELVQSSPLDLERFCMIKDSILINNKLDMVGIFCYCCKSSNHLVTQCSFIHLQQDKYKIIKEYVKNDFQGRDKDIQRRGYSYDSLQIKDQIDESARQYVEENIEELCTKGWFNDLVQQEYQNQLAQFKNSYGNPSRTSLKNINQLQNQYYFQKTKTNQTLQKQLSNIKFQYQKVKNTISNIQESQNMNTYIELHPFDKSSAHIQPRSNNNFQHAFSGYNDEFSQSLQAFNFNKKVQFSINSLQENSNDDNQTDNKSLQVQQCQSQQVINYGNNPIGFHHYQSNLGDCSFTPSNRQRQQSNYSEKCTSPKSTQNNILVNVNSANYYHQNNPQNTQASQNIQCYNPQTSNYCINDILQQFASFDSSKQININNQDTFSQVSYQNTQYDNQFYNRYKSQSKSPNQSDQQQRHKEYINSKENIKKSTLKSEIFNKKVSINPLILSKQLSNINQKYTNEALIKQLKELVQIPHNINTQQENFLFDILKSYQFYMPQNNYERVILSFNVLMRKNQANLSNQNTKKSLQKNKLKNIVKAQINKPIQFYKNLLKQNELENKQQDSNIEENHKNNSTQ